MAGGDGEPMLYEEEDGSPLPHGLQQIIRERLRQIDGEGYSIDGDDGRRGELIAAALAYGRAALYPNLASKPPSTWPWAVEFWKPSLHPGRNLEKAGALIAAALDQTPDGGIESPGGWDGL